APSRLCAGCCRSGFSRDRIRPCTSIFTAAVATDGNEFGELAMPTLERECIRWDAAAKRSRLGCGFAGKFDGSVGRG
ncbi:hypothetical protein, partial [Xanthomonas graminis]|uniref:hypothetical protein n=1 Tax=Xanthomonas graminis TaxID=3390026 RepID=UPI001E47A683